MYPHLIKYGIKVTHLKVALPITQLLTHLNNYTQFANDILQELEVTRGEASHDMDKDFIYHYYLEFPKLRKLRLINIPEIALKDYLRTPSLYLH